jgi:hypothetical protein
VPPAVVSKPPPAVPSKVAVEAPKITDWRQSWGKLDTAKTEVVTTPKVDAPKLDAPKTDVVGAGKPATPKTDTASPPSKPAPPKMETVSAPPAKPSSPALPWVLPGANSPKADTAAAPAKPWSPPALPVADTKRPDPLKDPATFLSKPADDRSAAKGTDLGVRTDLTKNSTAVAQAGPGGRAPLGTQSVAEAGSGGRAPLGTQSVLEAGSPQYVPVPIVTVPDYRRPPEPPPAHVPQPPEPNHMDMSNAFTNPNAAPPPPQVPVAANAFTNPPAPVDPTVAAGGAFGPTGQGYPPPGMYPPPGYGPRPQGMYPPPGSNPMARGMYPPPYGPMGQPGYPPNPAAMGQPVRQAGYQVAMANPAAPGAQLLPTGPARGGPTEAMATLRDSIYPSQREWAATSLTSSAGPARDDAINALVKGAREDPAPTVRAACVRSLAGMKAGTAPVIALLQGLKTDGDPRVLHEVEAALATLNQERMTR